MNILFTCFSRSWGGLEIQALEEATLLSRRDHSVWMACDGRSRLYAVANDSPVTPLPLNVHGYFHPAAILELSRFIRSNLIDVMHSQISRDIATIVPAMRLSGRRVPIVLSKRMGSGVSKKDILHQLTYRHVSLVLAISEVIRRNVIATTPLPAERVRTFHHSVDTETFSLRKVNRERVRAELGFSAGDCVIGFVGRFSPGKGHEEFLTSAHSLKEQYPAVRFAIVGEASFGEEAYERRIREMSHALELDNIVTFAGFRKDIPGVMAAFDIFAFPSHAESFGAVLIEAMAMERPVVSTNCDGVLDIVIDGKTGLFVPPKDAVQLTQKLSMLVDSPELRARMGMEGRKRVLTEFNQKYHAERLEEIYRSLIASHKGPPPV
jgi:glycosyltransferase involved in cell wall biosynthesis